MLVYFAATTQPACFFLPCQLGSGKHHDEWFWRILKVVSPHESALFGRHAENLASLPSHDIAYSAPDRKYFIVNSLSMVLLIKTVKTRRPTAPGSI